MPLELWPSTAARARRPGSLLAATFVVGVSLLAGRSAVVASPAPEKVRVAVVKRMLSIRNVDVEFSEVDDYTPSKAALALAAERHSDLMEGRFESIRRFSFLKGMVRYEESDDPATVAREEKEWRIEHGLVQNIFILSKTRFESFTQRDGLPAGGLIGNPSDEELSLGVVADVALGLRGDSPKAQWITAGMLDKAKVENDPESPDGAILTMPSEVGPLSSWWFRLNGGDIVITKYTYAKAAGEVGREIDCDDFRKVEGGYSLPYKMVEKIASRVRGGQPYCIETIDIKVRQYHPAADNTPDRYLMVWPLGTHVYDQRTRTAFLIRSAPRTLDDDFIAARAEAALRDAQSRLDRIATQPAATSQP